MLFHVPQPDFDPVHVIGRELLAHGNRLPGGQYLGGLVRAADERDDPDDRSEDQQHAHQEPRVLPGGLLETGSRGRGADTHAYLSPLARRAPSSRRS